MTFTIRVALVGDADHLGRLHVGAWQAAYRGIMSDDYLDRLDATSRAAAWRAALSAPREELDSTTPHQVIVACDGEAIVAMAAVGSDRSVDESSTVTGELQMLNVDPECWGSGAATALHAHALGLLARMSYIEAILWVVEANGRARRFYEREGWTADGESKNETIGGVVIAEVRYRIGLEGQIGLSTPDPGAQ